MFIKKKDDFKKVIKRYFFIYDIMSSIFDSFFKQFKRDSCEPHKKEIYFYFFPMISLSYVSISYSIIIVTGKLTQRKLRR